MRQHVVWGTGPSLIVLGWAFYYWSHFMSEGVSGFTQLMLQCAFYAGMAGGTALVMAFVRVLIRRWRQCPRAKDAGDKGLFWLAAVCGTNALCLYVLAFLPHA